MPIGLLVMALLGLLIAVAGLPALGSPAAARRLLRLAETPQAAYILRIGGMMLVALGAILIVFSFAFWRYSL